MDAVTAFLQGELNNEEIYMVQPEGFSTSEPNKVCKLKQALYGLKQASRVWNLKLDKALKSFGLIQSKYDTCIYYKFKGKDILIISIYVDDFLIFSNSDELVINIKKQLMTTFKMKDLGLATYCLGLRINRDQKGENLWLDQEKYTKQILNKFGMENCCPVNTPMNASHKISKDMCPKDEKEKEYMSRVPFREAIGCLNYLATVSRPDIAYAVSTLSQYSSNPGKDHWLAVKRVFRYLKGSLDFKLHYSKQDTINLHGYSDADWGGDLDTRRSTSGFIFKMSGGPVSWKTQKQSITTLSSCEAEYVSLSSACQEALWLYGFHNELQKQKQIEIFVDNQSAIQISNTNGYNSRTKHIDIRHHFVKDVIEARKIILSYIPTNKQLADGLTKPLGPNKFKESLVEMGLSN